MSRRHTAFVLGYHGCDKSIGQAAILGRKTLLKSEKAYDWLGSGIYFWENDPVRAFEWAKAQKKRGKVKVPYVIGAIIELRECLDLTHRENIPLVQLAYESLKETFEASGTPLPVNKDFQNGTGEDKLLRFLDCAVINHLIESGKNPVDGAPPAVIFDTVRGLFVEGEQIYPGAQFRAKSHTQISVINSDCIVGLFRVV